MLISMIHIMDHFRVSVNFLLSDFHIYVKEYREPSLSVVTDSTLKLKCLAILPWSFWPRLNEEYLEIVSQAVKKKQTNKKPTDVTTFTTYQCNHNFRKATSAKQNTERKKILGLWLQTSPITPVLNVGGESEETHCSLWWNLKKLILSVRNYKTTFSQYDTSIYVHTRKPTSTRPHSTILKATWSLRCFLLGRETSKLRLGKRIQKCQVTFIQCFSEAQSAFAPRTTMNLNLEP